MLVAPHRQRVVEIRRPFIHVSGREPPLDPGETIATVLPLPEDEDSWGVLNVVFATAKGRALSSSV